jgi:hypothetical protein
MSQLMKRVQAQLQLPLERTSVLPHPIEQVRSEMINVLADLLLEAMGPEENGSVEPEEASDEREDYA